MEYESFKRCVRRAGFNLKELASIVGMNHRSISNYSKHGEVPQYLAMIALMMVELDRRDVDIKAIAAKLDSLRNS